MLSVIIVNYNVRYFLEQCLFSVREAMRGLDGEVIVVDNASQDGSREYLEARFPEVSFIWNTENLGFGKANNLAMKKSRGAHILFLNPDTLVAEDCFTLCLRFMEQHPEAGALGVRMIDGSGSFLKESKRAYPSLITSFFKLSGLARIFPKSPVFARYHLGHLDPGQDHDVDVLAGAFMWVRREALEKTGGFDERFFMYGEDVDLSYRIQQAGYRNYYYSGTTIIHFKGESTKKGTLNYVRMFYKAMDVFVHKHYTSVTAFFFRFFITLAIWARAGIAALAGFLRKLGLPIVDAINILLAFIAAKFLWNAVFKPEVVYDGGLLSIAFPAFTVVFIMAAYYAGLYDKVHKRRRTLHAALIATIALLVTYSLLSEQYRFSRGILLLGSAFAFVLLSLSRGLMRRLDIIEAEEVEKLGTVVVGSPGEYEKAIGLMHAADKEHRVLGRISTGDEATPQLTVVGNLPHFLQAVPIRELIFCQGSLRFADIIRQCGNLPKGLRMRIMSSGSLSIIGSDSSEQSGEAVAGGAAYAICDPSSKRMKRLLDVLVSVFALVGFPLHILFVKQPLGLLGNAFRVLGGNRTWIGYGSRMSYNNGLPRIKKGILGCNSMPVSHTPSTEDGLHLLDEMYAMDYSAYKDLDLILRGYRWLGSR